MAILFYRARVYWIYILSIHPCCLKGNFQNTPALENRMAIHCLKSGWIGKYAPLGNFHPSALGQSPGPRGANCLRGAYFPIHPSSRQSIITIIQTLSLDLYSCPSGIYAFIIPEMQHWLSHPCMHWARALFCLFIWCCKSHSSQGLCLNWPALRKIFCPVTTILQAKKNRLIRFPSDATFKIPG